MAILTKERDVPFELCFKYPLQKGFTFQELSKQNIKEFQNFLNKVCRMSVAQVDASFARKPDKNDIFNGMQVYHYAITQKIRIHVINESGYYKIIRLDPNHDVHD